MNEQKTSSEVLLHNCFLLSSQGGIEKAALNGGLQKSFDVRIARKELTRNGPIMYAINTPYSILLLEMVNCKAL